MLAHYGRALVARISHGWIYAYTLGHQVAQPDSLSIGSFIKCQTSPLGCPTEQLFEMIVTMSVLALALSNPVAATQTAGHVDVNRAFNYVVVMLMEHYGISDVVRLS